MTVASTPPPPRPLAPAPLPVEDAIRRGLANLRANWQLAPMYFVQTLVVTVVFIGGGVLPLVAVGFDRWRDLDGWDPTSGAEIWGDALALIAELGAPLILGLVGAAVVWTLALLLLSWFQGGFYGVLTAGDRQAVRGRVTDWRAFRTFSLTNYAGWGARYLWRYFWFWNLFGLLMTGWLVLAVGVVFGAVWGADRYGTPAAVGIGCGGAMPVVFLAVVLNLWSALGAAHLGQDGSGVGAAARAGLRILGKRLGAVLAIFVLFFLAGITVSIVFSVVLIPLTLGSTLLFEDHFGVSVAAQAVNTLIQSALSSILAVALAGILVALVRSEDPR